LKHEEQYGKSEVWYIIDAEPGAGVYLGLKESLTKEELRTSIEDGSLIEKLNFVEVEAGDALVIEAGTIHAIGKGIMLCEVQQNSNLTYRLYDYGRLGADGKPRELHIDRALDVSCLRAYLPERHKYSVAKSRELSRFLSVNEVARHKYFAVSEYVIEKKRFRFTAVDSFQALVFIDGTGTVKSRRTSLEYSAGDTFFVPAGTKYTICPNEKTLYLSSKVQDGSCSYFHAVFDRQRIIFD
jgi:mannose-6-phosphate isomerase